MNIEFKMFFNSCRAARLRLRRLMGMAVFFFTVDELQGAPMIQDLHRELYCPVK
jgi:hypothetical protein